MIQDINKEFDNSYTGQLPKNTDKVIAFNSGKILLNVNDNKIHFPSVSQVQSEFVYLFKIGSTKYFLASCEEFDEYKFYDMAFVRGLKPKENVFASQVAFQLYNWYLSNQYCGKCGKKMIHSKTERAMTCSCGNTVYPKICPAVIVAITNKDKICLTKYNRPNAHWALVAGFNEIGETLEQTVKREVMEETGLTVTNIRYYKSQPWGFTSTLLSGYYCDVVGDDTIKIDNQELKAGKWFTKNEIDFDDDDLSLTREMINNFKLSDF